MIPLAFCSDRVATPAIPPKHSSSPFRKCILRGIVLLAAVLTFLPSVADAETVPPNFVEKVANVNGVKINYKIGGKGPAVVLLHGYAQTSHMWLPILPALGASHTVIAPDLRGAGDSDRPKGGYDKKTLAQDIHGLLKQAAVSGPVQVVGHDIGLMVAYAYAAQFPREVSRVILMDAFLPGVGDWTHVWLLRDLWHFHFHGETPLALVKGRERIYFEHFWNDFAADRTKSIPEADRQHYAAAYARADGMRAGFEYFKAFEQDAKDLGGFATKKLGMPFLVLTGERASGNFLIDQARLVASNVRGVVIRGAGHWLMEEAPDQVVPLIVSFLNETPSSAQARLTIGEVTTAGKSASSLGASGVQGVETRVLKGAPAQDGLYTIVLTVPANTRIPAHDHPDDRIATVVSGTWYFGYGDKFDKTRLKALPPGSFYTEPPGQMHFAETRDEPVVVQITGRGPTDTVYGDPAADPRKIGVQATARRK